MKSRSLVALILAAFAFASTPSIAATQTVYDDSLQNGWQNWGWAKLDYNARSTVHSGTSAIEVTVTQGGQALYLHGPSFGVADGNLTFWIDGGATGGQQLQVAMLIDGKAQQAVPLDPLPADSWQKITIPFARLRATNNAGVDGIWIQDRSGKPAPPFYVDDIVLNIDKAYIAPPPPQVHAAKLTVDAGRAVNVIDPRIFGVNTAVWDAHLADPASIRLLKAAGIRALRFPGGSTADVYDWTTGRETSGKLWSTNMASFAKVAEAVQATSYIIVNYGNGTPEMAAAWVAYVNGSPTDTRPLGIDSRGRDWKTVGYWAGLRAASPLAVDDGLNFLRVHHPAPYRFRYWEIGNECYGNWEGDGHGKTGLPGKPHDGYTYGRLAAKYLTQMRRVDPSIRIGVVSDGSWDGSTKDHAAVDPVDGISHTGFTPVVLSTLKSAGVLPDFVIIHRYVQMDGTHQGDRALLLTGSTGWPADVANIRKMITDYIGKAGSRIELDCTETNSGSMGTKEGTSLTDGLFLADTIATLMQTEVKACLWWDFRNGETKDVPNPALYGWRNYGDDGMVSSGTRKDCPLNTLFPPYYAEKLLSRWARGGDTVVDAHSDHPEIAVYAARRSHNRLALLVINKQPQTDIRATFHIDGFGPVDSHALAYRFGKPEDRKQRDVTKLAVDNASTRFTSTFPAYSMTIIILERRLR